MTSALTQINEAPPPDGGPSRSIRHSPAAWLLGLTFFALCLGLDTRHNDFAFSYHPDEGGKVGQIIGGTRNYHHPLLLLTATDLVLHASFIERTPQHVVEVGRWISAAFAAGSVVLLVWTVFLGYGTLAAWGAGFVLALDSALFNLAHYMKEDPALMFGISLTLFAAHSWWRSPGPRTLRLFALACGLAAAGKYVGAVTLPFAVPMVLGHASGDPGFGWKTRLRQFAIVFVFTFLICNIPFFAGRISNPFRSIGHQVTNVVAGHRGMTRAVPHGIYLRYLKEGVPLAVAACAAAYVLALAGSARRRTPPEWLLLVFPALFLGMLSMSPQVVDRYLLPVRLLVTLLGAVGAAEVARFVGGHSGPGRQIAAAVVFIGLSGWMISAEWPGFRNALDGFARDDHAAAAAWVTANLDRDAVIAEDHRVALAVTASKGESKDPRIPQRVLDSEFVADLGTLDELREQGVTHVAVGRTIYSRFENAGVKPREDEQARYDRRKAFYHELFATGELLKEWPPGRNRYLQPGIRLYRVAPPSPPAATPGR